MADDPVALFSVPFGDGDGSGQESSVKMPDFGKHFTSMTMSLTSIAKSVSSILINVQAINAKIVRGYVQGSPSPSQDFRSSPSRGDPLRVSKVFRVDPSKSIVPFRAKVNWSSPTMSNPPSANAISRFVDRAVRGASASPAEPIIDAQWTPSGWNAPGTGSSASGAGSSPRSSSPRSRAGSARSKWGYVPYVPGGGLWSAIGVSTARYLGIGTSAGAALAAGGIVLGASYLAYRTYQGVLNAGATTLRGLSQYSPNAAGFQASIDVAKFMSDYRIANSPGVIAASGVYSRTKIAYDIATEPIRAAGEMVKLGAATVLMGAFLTSPLGGTLAILGQRKIAQAMQGAGSSNMGFFGATLNGMLGGMLDIQNSPLTGVSGTKFPTNVSWNNGAWQRREIDRKRR